MKHLLLLLISSSIYAANCQLTDGFVYKSINHKNPIFDGGYKSIPINFDEEVPLNDNEFIKINFVKNRKKGQTLTLQVHDERECVLRGMDFAKELHGHFLARNREVIKYSIEEKKIRTWITARKTISWQYNHSGTWFLYQHGFVNIDGEISE